MPSGRKWTESEDEFLRGHHRSTVYRDIATQLDRTPAAVAHRVQKLGLQTRLRLWTPEEDAILRDPERRTAREIGDKLNRTPGEVSDRSRALGLPPWKRHRGYANDKYGRVVRGYRRENGRSVRITEHRAIMEEHLGRHLSSEEMVHHINCIKTDNALSNLHVFPDRAAHQRAHRSLDTLVFDLLERGIIQFNRTEGLYQLCHEK